MASRDRKRQRQEQGGGGHGAHTGGGEAGTRQFPQLQRTGTGSRSFLGCCTEWCLPAKTFACSKHDVKLLSRPCRASSVCLCLKRCGFLACCRGQSWSGSFLVGTLNMVPGNAEEGEVLFGLIDTGNGPQRPICRCCNGPLEVMHSTKERGLAAHSFGG